MKFQTKTFPAAFMLVLFLAVSLLGSDGTFLCFGKDGHVAIEVVDTCNGLGGGPQLAGMESNGCSPCKDVQFLSSPAYSRSGLHYTQTIPLMFPPVMLLSLPSKEYSGDYINLPQYSHHKTLATLHSVVLLI